MGPWLFGVARATADCSFPGADGVWPDGVAVTPDVRPLVDFPAPSRFCEPQAFVLVDAAGAETAVAVRPVAGVRELVPAAPLAPGTWALHAAAYGYPEARVATFEVALGAPPPPGPAEPAAVAVAAQCRAGGAWTEVTVTADFPDADGYGLVRYALADGGPSWTALPRVREARTLRAAGEGLPCLAVSAVTPAGQVLWAREPVCAAEVRPCPADGSDDPAPEGAAADDARSARGGGCGGGAGGVAVLAVLAGRRRRVAR